MEKEGQNVNSQELLDYHRKIQRHIELLQKIVTNLDLVDMVYRVGDWVEKAGVTDGDRSAQLAEILAAFESIIQKHWAWEENVVFPEFNVRGANKYTAKLLEEHKEFRRLFKVLKQNIARLMQLSGDGAKKDLEDQIKGYLRELLDRLVAHALEEEDAFFLVEHNI